MCAHEAIQGIKEARANIAALQALLRDMDPASGVSIAFRRGVAHDNPDQEDDATRRPWTTVETAHLGLARDAIGSAIRALEESLAFRLRNASDEHAKLGAFLITVKG